MIGEDDDGEGDDKELAQEDIEKYFEDVGGDKEDIIEQKEGDDDLPDFSKTSTGALFSSN